MERDFKLKEKYDTGGFTRAGRFSIFPCLIMKTALKQHWKCIGVIWGHVGFEVRSWTHKARHIYHC